MEVMTTAFLDNIQIDEVEYFVSDEEMYDSYEDDWESLIESDQQDWSMVEY